MVLGEGVRYKGQRLSNLAHSISTNATQDWVLLRSICSPTVQWLYSKLNAAFADKQMTAEEFVAEMSAQHGLGDSRSDIPKPNISYATTDTQQSPHNISLGVWCLMRPSLMVKLM